MARLSFGELLVVLALTSAVSMAVFAHADRRGNKHATAWGVATFLALALVVPIYVVRVWLQSRGGRRRT